LDLEEYADFLVRKIENIPFSRVIEVTTGCKVYPLSEADNFVMDELFRAAKEVLNWSINQNFANLRPNEICNRLEAELRRRLRGEIPEGKMAGYPDILVERNNRSYYIEVKLAGVKQLNSSLRTFYYEPVELSKVKKDACHILIGFIHKSKRILGIKIVDLSKIKVSLKNEFNTNNRELYRRENIIREFP